MYLSLGVLRARLYSNFNLQTNFALNSVVGGAALTGLIFAGPMVQDAMAQAGRVPLPKIWMKHRTARRCRRLPARLREPTMKTIRPHVGPPMCSQWNLISSMRNWTLPMTMLIKPISTVITER